MFVLLDKRTGGVYAVTDESVPQKVVQIFVDKDDADRYYQMLEACLLYTSDAADE